MRSRRQRERSFREGVPLVKIHLRTSGRREESPLSLSGVGLSRRGARVINRLCFSSKRKCVNVASSFSGAGGNHFFYFEP